MAYGQSELAVISIGEIWSSVSFPIIAIGPSVQVTVVLPLTVP